VWELLRGIALTGYSSETLDGAALRAAMTDVLALTMPPPKFTTFPLARAAEAHALIEARGVQGRVLLVP